MKMEVLKVGPLSVEQAVFAVEVMKISMTSDYSVALRRSVSAARISEVVRGYGGGKITFKEAEKAPENVCGGVVSIVTDPSTLLSPDSI